MAIFTELWSNFCGLPNSSSPAQNCEESCGLPLSFSSELLHTFLFSSCSEHALITITYLVFLLTFWSIILINWARRRSILSKVKPQKPFRQCVAVINIILGAINLGLGIWFLQEKLGNGSHLTPLHEWLVLLVQGLAWFTLGLTVTRGLKRSMTRFVRVWWVVSFLLGTVDGVSAGMNFISDRELSYGTILSLLSWPACCSMLITAVKEDLKYSEGGILSEIFLSRIYRNYGPLDSSQRFSEENQMLLKLNSNVTPFAKAGFFSRMTFWWLNSLLSKGIKRPLEEDDLPCVCGDDQAKNSYTIFTEELVRQKRKNPCASQTVFWALVSCHRKNLARTGFYALLNIVTLSSGPLLLNAFIGFSEGRQSFKYEGFILVGTLFIAKAIESISQRQWYFGTKRIGLQLRSSIIAAIYQKQLKLSNEAKQVHSAGEIMNYMAVDAYRIGEFPFSFHQTWTAVLQLIFGLSILVHAIGWATLSALAVIIITMLCNSPLAKLQQKFQTELMSAQDQRLSVEFVISTARAGKIFNAPQYHPAKPRATWRHIAMGVVKRGFCQRASEQPNQLTRVGCTNPKPLSPAGKGRLFCQRLVSELRPIRSTDKDFTQPARTLILLLRHVLFNVFTEGVINLGKSLYDFIRQAWA